MAAIRALTGGAALRRRWGRAPGRWLMRAGRGRFGRLFRDGFRCCPDSDVYPLNLMLFAGCTAEGWRRFWYANLDDLADPAKHLVRWIAGEELERASRPGTESRHG